MRRAAALQVFACAVVMACWAAAADTPHRLEPAPTPSPPSFVLDRLDGEAVDLAHVRSPAVLVHFFATWCEPCKAEFATLALLSARRPDIQILTINVAEPAARVRNFVAAERISLPILLDADRKVTKAWHVRVLPTTFVLDATHTARLFVEGDLDWTLDDTLSAIDAVTGPKP